MMNTALSFVNNTLENQSSILFPRPDFESKTDEWVWDQSEAQYQQNTCGIVSRVAYLTGVEKRHFIAPHTRIEYEVYQQLEQNAQARIVRHLSMLRTAINLNFRQIDQAMVYEMKNIHLLPWTKEIVQALQKDGVEMVKSLCYFCHANCGVLAYVKDGDVIKIEGSVELAPILGLADAIVDIVETGATLRENGLHILEEVCPLSARVVVNQVSMKMESERISELLGKLKKVIKEADR